jgi:hypothetical protein
VVVVVVLSLTEGVTVVVVVVSFRGADGGGAVLWIEIQPDSTIDANIAAIRFIRMDDFTPTFELAML